MSSPALRSGLRVLSSERAWVVGGAVRDRLMGRRTDDIDIAVDGDAEAVAMAVARAAGGRAFPLHAELGIHRVVLPGSGNIDIARIQGRTFEDDLDRRDFTVNALAVPVAAWGGSSWRRRVVDRHKGLVDLRRRRIVPVSKKIFKDDPLRLLRAFRMAAELDFSLTPAALALIRAHRKGIRQPAGERIREELLRIFDTPRAHAALAGMEKTGLLSLLFPPADALRRTAPDYYGKGGVLKHTLDSVKCFEEIEAGLTSWFPRDHKKVRAYLAEELGGYSRSAHCKWGLLLHDIGKPKTAKKIDGRLRFFQHEHVGANMVDDMSPLFRWSTDEQRRYASWVRHHMRVGNLAVHPEAGDKAFHRFFRDLGDEAVSMLLVSLADHLSYLTPAQKKRRATAHEKTTIVMMRKYHGQKKKLMPARLIDGNDLMRAFNLPPSPLIGRLLSEALEAQVDGQARSKEDLIERLRPRLAQLQAEQKKP